MKAKIIHVLCEGQTEQGFVEAVLKPYLIKNGVTAVKTVLVTTNKKKNARGGAVSYAHAEYDLNVMLSSNIDNEYERHIFTTMFDLYALPDSFPGYQDAHAIVERYGRVVAFELAWSDAVGSQRFIP